MTTNAHRESAKIYQFPAGGRAALGSRRDEAKHAQNAVDPGVAKIACAGAWYHDEAVRAERAGKN